VSRGARIVGIGCGLLALVAIGGGFLACTILAPMPAREAAQGFLADVRAANWSAALQRTSASYQREHDAASLARAVASVPSLMHHTSATFVNGSLDEDRANLDGFLSSPEGDAPIAVEAVRADGYWYVDALVVQGVPLE